MTLDEFQSKMNDTSLKSKEKIQEIVDCEKTFENLFPLIRDYLYLRFMLYDGYEDTENIIELASISIENLAEYKRGGLKIKESTSGCSSVSSSVTKKVLLLISMQKALAFKFSKNETADIITISDLTNSIIQHSAS